MIKFERIQRILQTNFINKMTNESIADALKLYGQLLDLHGKDTFKANSYQNASFKIDKLQLDLSTLDDDDLSKIEGIGISIRKKIAEIRTTGSFKDLDELLMITPEGILEMLKIKGLGPKKIGRIWKEMGIENTGELLYACNENRLSSLSGFGEKTQLAIIKSIEFLKQSENWFHYATAEKFGNEILSRIPAGFLISYCGAMRRKNEIIDIIEICTTCPESEIYNVLNQFYPGWKKEKNYIYIPFSPPVHFIHVSEDNYIPTLFVHTATHAHLTEIGYLESRDIKSETDIYNNLGFPYIIPEMREGTGETKRTTAELIPVMYGDIKGCIHNHSMWSDGINTLEEMAMFCEEMGLQYFGICDHSKTAVYANGLSIVRVQQQWEEIENYNNKNPKCKIYKGIESDILNDGTLDYPDEILAGFDFVVASVHQNLKMDQEKATTRLLKAIENKYTRIIGHPTGRLLLSRPGYGLDFKKIIDACAANGVVIELNAHPYRLDIDWRHIPYCIEKGVKISINPDAHRCEGMYDMQYGIHIARKGGASANDVLNTYTRDQFESWLKKK